MYLMLSLISLHLNTYIKVIFLLKEVAGSQKPYVILAKLYSPEACDVGDFIFLNGRKNNSLHNEYSQALADHTFLGRKYSEMNSALLGLLA